MFLKMFFLDLNGTSNIIMPYLLFKNGLMFFLDLNGTSNIIMPYLLFKNGLMFFLDLNGTSNIMMPYLLFKNGLSDFRFDVQYTGSKIKVMKRIETIITLSTVERKHAFLVYLLVGSTCYGHAFSHNNCACNKRAACTVALLLV